MFVKLLNNYKFVYILKIILIGNWIGIGSESDRYRQKNFKNPIYRIGFFF